MISRGGVHGRDPLTLGLSLMHAVRNQALSAQQLAERADVTPDHVRRVMQRLEDAGWVEKAGDGLHRWRATKDLPTPVKLTKRERRAAAVLRALASLCRPYQDVVGMEDLVRKVDLALGVRSSDPLESLLVWKPAPGDSVARLSRILDAVVTAVENRQAIHLLYEPVLAAAPSKRLVSVQRILRWNHLIYLLVWEHEKGALRIFALTRCKEAWRSRTPRVVRPAAEVEAFVAAPFGVFQAPEGEVQDVVIRFSPRVATYATEIQWHPTQQVEKEARAVRLTLRVPVTDDLVGWVLQFQGEAVPLAPATLVRKVREGAARLMQACPAP